MELYHQLIQYLGRYGRVLTEHVGDPALAEEGESISDTEIYERDMSWLGQSHALVAEISIASFGVGYEVGWAESRGKRVLLLYRETERKLSAMALGNSRSVRRCYTSLQQAMEHIDDFFRLDRYVIP